MNCRQKGKFYERIAAAYLQEQGLEMIEQNFFCPIGEIDLIAREDTCLVFVEVKYRSSLQKGYPVEAVSFSKQKRIYRVAQWYLWGILNCNRHLRNSGHFLEVLSLFAI